MSDEVCYSNVVFTTPYNSAAPVKKNEEAVYAEVKKAELAPVKTHPEPDDSRTTGQETWSPAQAPEKPEHRYQPQQCAVVFLSLTCAFLLAGIIALSVCWQLRKENGANQQLQKLESNLTAQKESLESENTQLRKDRTLLDEILQFRNFPVEKYCSKETRCSHCPSGWTFNNSKCYFVHLGQTWKTWKTWNDSRLECIKMGADLLTIQNKEEQMFIMNLAPIYEDKWHGYWIGLTGKAKDWVWINGSSLTTGFWADNRSQTETHVLTNTGHKNKILNSWRSTEPIMRNRWICENRALLF
ncbi:C-type lectin domain family 9 member A-like isoform X3 [Brienomyrus brachyistius]|uniref:C-type lectin domain family 9 member A-like isoform X3 n=1 Tax=Brienomyrus brachyistius TaxID=42636 RepID=UPI0020B2D4F2|nr:C-type lectin domain family 9 member A-like isoform X3 [Brienomyrus brachyistius]